jgi:F-type H+-transporting ATPase subunit b
MRRSRSTPVPGLLPRLVACCTLLLPLAVLASEDAHHGHGGIPWGTLLFNLVNFSLLCWIFARFGLPLIRDYASSRRARIVEELQAASKARAEAEQLKAHWESRLAGLDQEISQIRQQAAADTAREREQILATARRTAETIRNDARRAAAQEVRRAEAELRETVAREATTVAAQLMRERLTAADQERFIREFLGRVKETRAV